jgi:hypothetical protein
VRKKERVIEDEEKMGKTERKEGEEEEEEKMRKRERKRKRKREEVRECAVI